MSRGKEEARRGENINSAREKKKKTEQQAFAVKEEGQERGVKERRKKRTKTELFCDLGIFLTFGFLVFFLNFF